MSIEAVTALGMRAMYVTLLVSAPLLGFALLIGILISIFQAVTQIQEMTLTFVPKIIVVMLSVVVFGPWILSTLMKFTLDIFNTYIPQFLNKL